MNMDFRGQHPVVERYGSKHVEEPLNLGKELDVDTCHPEMWGRHAFQIGTQAAQQYIKCIPPQLKHPLNLK